MEKWRAIVGMIGSILLLLSSVAHSFVGWPELRLQLELAGTTPDLMRGLQVSWIFGGMAMLVFGLILLRQYLRAWSGGPFDPEASLIIGAGYLGFGIWAIVTVERNPFYAVFVIPGAMLLLASRKW